MYCIATKIRWNFYLTACLWFLFISNCINASCEYSVTNDWGSGFVASINVTNERLETISNWNVQWQYTDGSSVISWWNASISGGNPYSAEGTSWNSQLAPGETVQVGIYGVNGSGRADIPFLSGNVCNSTGSSSISSSSSSTNSSYGVNQECFKQCNWYGTAYSLCDGNGWQWNDGNVCIGEDTCALVTGVELVCLQSSSSSSESVSSSSSSSSSISSKSSSSFSSLYRMNNPWENADYYVNPKWSQLAAASAGGSAITSNHTAIWLESLDDIAALQWHMDKAVEQSANLISIVINNLPNRDCQVANGREGAKDLVEYQQDFIDPIVDILEQPEYANIRVVAVIEVNAFEALMISGMDFESCDNAYDEYVTGMHYVVDRFSELGNVYSYLDIGNAVSLGWSHTFPYSIRGVIKFVESSEAGWDGLAGFATNVAGYVPVLEPFLQDTDLQVGGQLLRSSDFYQWNMYFDELHFVQEWRENLIAQGAPESIGMIIDTSRNGWGGEERPTIVSQADDINTYTDESRIDRRLSRENWCNQKAGLGERPQPSPYEGIDAFAWIKVPGESDGDSAYSKFCHPLYDPIYIGINSGAMNNAPARGTWFDDAFSMLLKNAYPPIIAAENRDDNP